MARSSPRAESQATPPKQPDPPLPTTKAEILRARASALRNLPRYAAAAERQERTSLEQALFFCTAAILEAIATAVED